MLKRDLRLFFSALFVTLLLCGWVAVFLLVDNTSSQFGNSSTAPALKLSLEEDLDYDLALLGQEYVVSLEPYNELEALRKKYACLATPRALLTAEQVYSLAVYGWRIFYEQYKEDQYIQNVANSQEGVPVE